MRDEVRGPTAGTGQRWAAERRRGELQVELEGELPAVAAQAGQVEVHLDTEAGRDDGSNENALGRGGELGGH